MEKPLTPTLDKLVEYSDEAASLSVFLDWLRDKDYLSYYDRFESLLYDYFELDEQEAGRERRALLEFVRASTH